MKRLLATAIALSTLGALPVVAETTEQTTIADEQPSIWLVLSAGHTHNLHSLPMKSMEQCEEQGAIYVSSKRMGRASMNSQAFAGFECLEGK